MPDGTLLMHPEEVDSGVVAGIFIAVAISVTILLGFVSEIDLRVEYIGFRDVLHHWEY